MDTPTPHIEEIATIDLDFLEAQAAAHARRDELKKATIENIRYGSEKGRELNDAFSFPGSANEDEVADWAAERTRIAQAAGNSAAYGSVVAAADAAYINAWQTATATFWNEGPGELFDPETKNFTEKGLQKFVGYLSYMKQRLAEYRAAVGV